MGKESFGTDGWRGIIAEDFTVKGLRTVVQAIVGYVKDRGEPAGVVVGYDTRFMSEYYARVAAEVVCGNGVRALISPTCVTTPMVSHAVVAFLASGGIMITASHNPHCYSGVKFKASYGGSASLKITSEIEARIGGSSVLSTPYDRAREEGCVGQADFFGPYRDNLCGLLDAEALKRGAPTSALDAMHGSAGQYAGRLWEGLGLELKVLHGERDPYFGGIAPEPSEENLSELSAEVKASGSDIGFATDGDGDRLGVVDDKGGYVTPHQVLALLLLHMYRNRRLEGTVVKTVSTTSLIDRIAADLGLPVKETPVGFKHICELMLTEDVLIGGEENGGVGIKGQIPERDGLLTALLLTEMMAVEGKGIRELIAEMDRKYGRLYHKRYDARVEGAKKKDIIKDVYDRAKSVYRDLRVESVNKTDGLKLTFKDGSWVLFRASGTEPVYRIYAEALSREGAEMLINRAREEFVG